MADETVNVDAVLKEAKSRFKTTEVSKEVDPELDVGNMLLTDLQPVSMELFRKKKEDFLVNIARDNTQLLFNELWKLPVERYENVLLAQLPEPTTVIPREKPVPKPKPLTKWQEFAKSKGINKTKRERKIWDEAKGEYLPRYGYKRTKDDTQDWVAEVPQNADPYEDQFEKRIQKKKEKVAKNEYQRLRNIAKHKKVKIPDKNLQPTRKANKEQLQANVNATRKANASIGKFTKKLSKEKVPKNPEGRKRKFEKVAGEFASEKSKSLEVVDKIFKKAPSLDLNK
ncbi:hypothetical protein QZH41_015161, partial [Actinostola sp. cb2023]